MPFYMHSDNVKHNHKMAYSKQYRERYEAKIHPLLLHDISDPKIGSEQIELYFPDLEVDQYLRGL